jgi:hypothetical protein
MGTSKYDVCAVDMSRDRIPEKENPRDVILGTIKNNSDLRISKVANGYMVNVGCKTFVFTSLSELLGDIENFYSNPEEIIKKYSKFI